MDKRSEKFEIYKPPPPPYLSKETLIIWEVWSRKGDREVAREAAAKGSHTDLVFTFLSQRKALPIEDTKIWFRNEIIKWANELLTNKQIFRASHILRNVQEDPADIIINLFQETTNQELREFLGNHLNENKLLSEDLQLFWEILNLLKSNNELNINLEEFSISKIKTKSDEWKYDIAAKLFLKTENFKLTPLLKSEYLWSSALQSKNIEFICNWIKLNYSEFEDEFTDLNLLLSDLEINDVMLENILIDNESSIGDNTKDKICDTLASFGIFNHLEKNSLLLLIKRLIQTKNFHKIDTILSHPSANIDILTFKQLICDYCVINGLYSVLDICTKKFELPQDTNELKLIQTHRDLTNNLNNLEIIRKNSIATLNYIGDLCDNQTKALVLLFDILLNKNGNTYKLLSESSMKDLIFMNFPIVQSVFDKISGKLPITSINVYDILRKHCEIDVVKLFKHRFDEKFVLPHFNLKELVETYGYKKELDYTYYIGELQPSKACIAYQNGKYENVHWKVYKIAMRNFNQPEITASCIAFMEMIEFDSSCLRIEITAANSIYNSNLCSDHELIELFLKREHEIILNLFERSLCSDFNISSNTPIKDLINFIQSFEMAIKYANYHDLKPPTLLPSKLAENNLWLGFIISVQIYNYEENEVEKLVRNFKDEVLLEHLNHALLHDVQYEQKSNLMRDRDSRKYYLSRIGVRKTENDLMVSSTASQSSLGSTGSSTASDYIGDLDIFDTKTDLLQILICCHNSNDPPKALLQACVHYKYPLLAVLATNYEPDSYVINWLIWLSISCDLGNVINYEQVAVSGSQVTEFLKLIMENQFYKTLVKGFDIFLPENPLEKFATFLKHCIDLDFNIEHLKELLEAYHKQLKFKRSNSFITEIDHDLIYLNHKMWIEHTALILLAATLQNNFQTFYNKIQFLELLKEIDIQTYFYSELPNFDRILKILSCIFEYNFFNVELNFYNLCDVTKHLLEINKLIDTILYKEMFEEALKIAEIYDINKDKILLKKWEKVFSLEGILPKLQECDGEFNKFNVNPKNACKFFMNFTTIKEEDRYHLLKIAYKYACIDNLSELKEIERDMWSIYLKLDIKDDIPVQRNPKLFSDIKLSLLEIEEIELPEDKLIRLSGIIDNLLNEGNVYQAFRIERMFGHKNGNLEILRVCFNLAEGLILPFQLDTRERLLLQKGGNYRSLSHRKKHFLSTRLSGFSSLSRSPGALSVGITEIESPAKDTISLIENLVDNLSSGIEIGQKILMTYRISVNIEIPYCDILECTDPINLLFEALKNDCNNKLEIVYDFIQVYKWTKQQIADFLCEQIINVIMQATESKLEVFKMLDINLDTDIHLILQLLPHCCTMLGMKLYNYANALHKAHNETHGEPDKIVVIHVIELIIRAHDCYTADCNMEGISIVLKKCQTLVNLLLSMKDWRMMVRLLTGVGRYNELNYVFHILRENDQFEFLLRKGKTNLRDNGLKIALLAYLKKFCPDNKELYKMVALHFSLYSEVAELWENEAKSIIRNLIAISKLEMQNRKVNPDACLFVELTNTDGTRLILNKAMENYNHAAEYHLQGEKLSLALNAARQAELIALQVSLLKGLANNGITTCILNMDHSQINAAITSYLSFPQTLILTEAYNHQTDWANVIYEQYILQDQLTYFENFCSTFELTDTLVYDISRRFLSSNISDEISLKNMENIVRLLPTVHTKYRIASELGFTNIVEELINGNRLIYLKDTVWKKGYRE